MIGIALQILSALATSGAAPAIIKSLIGLMAGDKGEEIAGKILGSAKGSLGTDDPKQVELMIAQDKTASERLVAQIEADTERYRIEVQDRESARKRDAEVRSVGGGTNIRANVMLGGTFVCLIVVLVGVMYFRASIPDGIAAILNTACGSMLTLLGQAFNFEFGSSRSSAEKTNQMADLLTQK